MSNVLYEKSTVKQRRLVPAVQASCILKSSLCLGKIDEHNVEVNERIEVIEEGVQENQGKIIRCIYVVCFIQTTASLLVCV